MSMNKVAELAHNWLEKETETNRTMWVWVSSREDGVDLARAMHKLHAGDHATTNVPYDTLPTYAANATTNNRVFILSQPNHAEACLITMQEDKTRTDVRWATPGEKYYYEQLAAGKTDADIDIDHVVSIMSDAHPGQFDVKAPDLFVVDVEEPYWNILVQYIQPKTQVLCSDKVKVHPPRDES